MRRKTKAYKRFRLEAWWSRDEGVTADLTPRRGNAHLAWLFDCVFSKEVQKEFQARGFDLETLRFQIDMTPESILEHEKRAGRA